MARKKGKISIALILGIILIIADIGVYMVWAGNMLSINLDNQNDDRYMTLIFWRLVIMAVGIAPVGGWGIYFAYKGSTGFLFILASLITAATVAIQLTAYGWFIVDLTDCSNVVHCFGNGTGPFGVDIAFFLNLITTGIEIIIAVLLLLLGFIVRHGVITRRGRRLYGSINDPSSIYGDDIRDIREDLEITTDPNRGSVVRIRRDQ